MDDGQLLAKDERCATSGSKIMTRTVNELIISSKNGKMLQLAFKLIMLASRASWIVPSAFGGFRAVERLFRHKRVLA